MILKPGDVLCLRVDVEKLDPRTGRLDRSPVLQVAVFDEEANELRLEPVSFAVLEALAPEKFKAICAELKASRDVNPPVRVSINTDDAQCPAGLKPDPRCPGGYVVDMDAPRFR
ncbi:hypothetical protein ASF58_23230 [Methylobacterium sp. Leaf125]|uniref:hypothetical protein n=1 Tax=Methylobacterium sp. Leaf125 TaxID=1736265 RepID=UPI000701FB5B|nr:hypothetical protein [Methylobacterium sp. Leaf125]KQQ39056.1 hypothetical protein ASF58_23230 [Methylobacterium sp. Leaf125]